MMVSREEPGGNSKAKRCTSADYQIYHWKWCIQKLPDIKTWWICKRWTIWEEDSLPFGRELITMCKCIHPTVEVMHFGHIWKKELRNIQRNLSEILQDNLFEGQDEWWIDAIAITTYTKMIVRAHFKLFYTKNLRMFVFVCSK